MILLAVGYNDVFAQKGFFVPKAGKIFFVGDSSTIFSDVINNGNFGVGRKAYVNFSGKQWSNDPQAQINDDDNAGTSTTGDGGWIRFLSDSIRQKITGGYNAAAISGPSFPHIKIENKSGVELINGSTKVRNEVSFDKGHVYLNDQIMVVGNGNPGTISDYDSTRFFVTGNKAGDGLLIRENIRKQDGLVTFPVGSHDSAYTPAAIRGNAAFADDYYVSVFDSVRLNGSTGLVITSEGVNKTWQIGKRFRPGLDPIDIQLQHLNGDEGTFFNQNRQYAYVSAYTNNLWDLDSARGTPGPGLLTTSAPLVNSSVNSRAFLVGISANTFMTKFTGKALTGKTIVWLNAYRIDTGRVKVYWKTNPELNVKTFIVQRRLANETNFRDVRSVPSQAINGYSVSDLNYDIIDPNNYTGVSFYRLMLVPYTGVTAYSDTVAVGPIIGEHHILLWPNPTTDLFNISLYKTLPVKSIIIWNVLGQKLREEKVNGRTLIQMRGLLPGTYLVSFILEDNRVYETKKLIVY